MIIQGGENKEQEKEMRRCKSSRTRSRRRIIKERGDSEEKEERDNQ